MSKTKSPAKGLTGGPDFPPARRSEPHKLNITKPEVLARQLTLGERPAEEPTRRSSERSPLLVVTPGNVHPAANLFPLMEGEPYDQLVSDITMNGLRQPIIRIGGAILDGRNRLRACLDAGVEPRFEDFSGDDPLSFVLSANLHRRHLNESQRAMVASKLENMQQGRRRSGTAKHANLHVSRQEAARTLNVSTRSVADAKVVRERGASELIRRVELGDIPVSLAAQIVGLPQETQVALSAGPATHLRGAVKKYARSARERALAEATRRASDQLGTKLYSVIMADPPWRFEPYSRETGLDRAADNHYETMPLDEIKALNVPAAENCVLFLWATPPLLPDALSVMSAWGFTYRSHCIWDKGRPGNGYWFRQEHEVLLVGVRGHVPAPAPGEQCRSIIHEHPGSHSAKPKAAAEMVEAMFPNAEKLEMFARIRRDGWDFFGNEVS
jgi:N6-adenosine-specific RNA methylase IME4/ParB-like chromosome segregation protein Spo0J